MRRLFKYLVRLLFLGLIAFAVYAVFGKLPAPEGEAVLRLPVPQASE